MDGAKIQQKVLVADDEDMHIRRLTDMLQHHGYAYDTARDGFETLEKSKAYLPDIILLDMMLPDGDAYQVCKCIKDDPATQHIPVIIITSHHDMDSRVKGLEAGASDFLTKPTSAEELMLRIRNLLRLRELDDSLKQHQDLIDAEVKKRTTQLRLTMKIMDKSAELLKKSQEKLKGGYIDTIQRLTMVAEYKDEDTVNHIKRVGHYCYFVAKKLGWSDENADALFYASPMHDIGKVGIPTDILLKPAKLSTEEFALIKTHTTIGGRILCGSPSTILQMAERIAMTHHERWNGQGYPKGLKGEDIPVEGRIMIIADHYDALRSRRPYKPPLDHDSSCKIITKDAMADSFDPAVLQIFKDYHGQFEEIFETHKD